VSKRLKEARIAAGFSQKSLGIAAGIDEFSASARMNQYETGKHAPDYLMLTRIAKILKLPTAYFYAESDEMAELVKIFDRLKKSERAGLIKKLGD
jgi:transcriptional regulator with XRE-family HTH domain